MLCSLPPHLYLDKIM